MLSFVAVRSCRVIATDPDGIEHSVDVSAETLFEAVGLAICSLRQDDWTPPAGLRLRVTVRPPVVEHVVEMRRFEAWLNGSARSPREKMVKEKLKEMLGRQ